MKGGEYGPLFDKGVLEVIAQIEKAGNFVPERRAGAILTMAQQPQLADSMLTEGERTQAKRFLAERGWSLAQGAEYMSGVQTTEKNLSSYRRDRA
jgi:hypothetical protein